MENQTTLVATLGGEPQVVTFLLDLLIQRGTCMDQVVIVYLGGSARYTRSFRKLAAEFEGDQYAGRPCHLRGLAVRQGQRLIADAYEPADVEAVRRTFHDLLDGLKAAGGTVHLGLSGGRRIMSLTALAAATQYLTPADHLWHIFTPDALTERARGGQIMHAPPDGGPRLIEVPFVPWAAYFPGLAPLLDRTPAELNSARLGWLSEVDLRRCRQVWENLSARQRDALRAFAKGLSRKEAAQQLGVAVSTVDTYREAILETCRSVWQLEGEDFLPRYMREKFAPFITRIDSV